MRLKVPFFYLLYLSNNIPLPLTLFCHVNSRKEWHFNLISKIRLHRTAKHLHFVSVESVSIFWI